MIATPEPTPPDDLLARAEDALRRAPVPEGPSAELLARILGEANSASYLLGKQSPATIRLRWRIRFAAAIVVTATIGLAASAWLSTPALALAEVARKLREAHGMSYVMTLDLPGAKRSVAMRFLFKEPGLLRCEAPGGRTILTDLREGKTLVIEPETKTALLISGIKPASGGDLESLGSDQWIAHLRSLAGEEGEAAGDKTIGGIKARGFRVKVRGQDMIVWADPRTKLPLLIEVFTRIGDQLSRSALSDFTLDPELDDALFRLVPPPGYTLRTATASVPGGDPEAAIVWLLRAYAEKSGGTFPPRLDDWPDYDRRFPVSSFTGMTDPALHELTRMISEVQLFLLERGSGDGYGYQPGRVKLGDARQILLWYRVKQSANYRAIFGDLHVAEVDAAQIPRDPKP